MLKQRQSKTEFARFYRQASSMIARGDTESLRDTLDAMSAQDEAAVRHLLLAGTRAKDMRPCIKGDLTVVTDEIDYALRRRDERKRVDHHEATLRKADSVIAMLDRAGIKPPQRKKEDEI